LKTFETIEQCRKELSCIDGSVGLIPTMGSIHKGHLNLVRASKIENTTSIVTLFVNPSQFGRNEDFDQYPRDIDQDMVLLENEGIDILFAPKVREIYPLGFSTFVDIGDLSKKYEGLYRPEHFRGVSTIVTKLLSIFRPNRAYFGQKDAQQCAVIKKLNDDLNLGSEIIIVPTARDQFGMALSSRNIYLSELQKKSANHINLILFRAKKLYHSKNMKSCDLINFISKSLPIDINIEYVSIVNRETFATMNIPDVNSLIIVAVNIGSVRLIDNVSLS
jgi:pantoate--beta-alanine ligase